MTQDERAELLSILNPTDVKAKMGARLKALEYVNSIEAEIPTKAEKKPSGRTGAQNSALHLWYKQSAEILNESGLTVKKVLDKAVDFEWTAHSFKEILWREAQNQLFGTTSTRDLKKSGEIDQVYDHLNRHIGQEFGAELPPFPNEEGKNNMKLKAVENLKNPDYPEYTGAPTI